MKKRTADSILRYIREENVSGIPPETVYAGWNLNFGYPPDTAVQTSPATDHGMSVDDRESAESKGKNAV